MIQHHRTEIPLSKTKLVKLLFFSLLFLVAGLWLIIKNPQVSNPVFNNAIFKSLAAYGGTIMGALGIYFFSRKLFDKNPGLVLSEQGIYVNSNAFKFGWIPWSDVSKIYGNSAQGQHFVVVGLVDPEKYISKETNTVKKKLLQLNARNYGSPVHISTNGLKTTHKDLLNSISAYFEQYKLNA